MEPIEIDGRLFTAVSVQLPKTTLLTVSGEKGYIMCGALDVHLLNTRLADRKIVAGKATGVRTIAELLNAPLAETTIEAEKQGVHRGMTGRDALICMHE
jgi:uncharacterized protein YunC (DUF1805 family)